MCINTKVSQKSSTRIHLCKDLVLRTFESLNNRRLVLPLFPNLLSSLWSSLSHVLGDMHRIQFLCSGKANMSKERKSRRLEPFLAFLMVGWISGYIYLLSIFLELFVEADNQCIALLVLLFIFIFNFSYSKYQCIKTPPYVFL